MKWFYDFVIFMTALPGLIWFRTKVIFPGGKKVRIKGGALVVSNHIGFYDPIYLMYGIWYRRHRFVCMQEFMEKKFVGKFFRMCMCIPIDRDNLSMDSFREITDALKQGGVVTMFPEGHVNLEEGAAAKAYKSGMVLMALRGNAPIVPVCIEKRKHFWNRLRVVVGEPIDLKAKYGARPSLQDIDRIAEDIHTLSEDYRKLLEETK